jgi:hypothetical protein
MLRRVYYGQDCRAAIDGSVCQSLIADVTVRTDQPIYPRRHGEYCVFPVGEFRTALCGPELLKAATEGNITRWHSAAEYLCRPFLDEFFGHWLSRLSAARKEGRELEQQWIKALMVGMVGKFAETGKRWVPVPSNTERGENGQYWHTGPGGRLHRYRNLAYSTMRLEEYGESYWSMPAVTGWITSAGRLYLWRLIKVAGRDNVWYCDTDSLITNRAGYERLLSGGYIREGEAGYLRLLASHRRGAIHGIRHFELDAEIWCSGVPKGEILPGETREEYFLRRSLKGEVTMGHRPRGIKSRMRYPKPGSYHHGIVTRGGRVVPFTIMEE